MMLEDRPWIEAAQFASYHCQLAALKLNPWDEPAIPIALPHTHAADGC